MRNTLLLAALLCLALPALAVTSGPDRDVNFVRVYGYVIQNTTFADGSGFLTLHLVHWDNPAANEVVRLEYPDNASGAADLLSFADQYVVIHAELDSVAFTCVDGPNTFVKPVIVWRWTGNSWEIFGHDCRCWLPWP